MPHTKKMLAVAVAGALAAPAMALAQTSTVQIGGSIHLIYAQHNPGTDASGTVNGKSHDYLATSEPEIYVRGEENLGGGLSAWFQCTSSFDILGSQTAGKELAVTVGSTAAATTLQGYTTTNGWCGRNSGLGFKGNFGNIFAGTWDTPHKLVFNKIRGWWGGTNPFSGGAILVAGGAASNAGNGSQSVLTTATGTPLMSYGTNGNSFFRRQSRSINWWSPSWNGFNVNAAYSSGNEATSQSQGSPLKPRMYSIAGNYESGPLYLGLAYENHKDYNPGGSLYASAAALNYNGGTDHSWIFGAGYTFGGVFKLTGLYQKNHYDVNVGGVVDTKGYAIYGDWAIQGPHSLKFQYANVSSPSGSASAQGSPSVVGNYIANSATGAGATLWGVQYAYAFSKRTVGYLGYNKLNNDNSATFNLGISSSSAGGTQTLIGGGLRHSF